VTIVVFAARDADDDADGEGAGFFSRGARAPGALLVTSFAAISCTSRRVSALIAGWFARLRETVARERFRRCAMSSC